MVKEELVTQGKWVSPQEFNKARAGRSCRTAHPASGLTAGASLRRHARRCSPSIRRCLALRPPSCAATSARLQRGVWAVSSAASASARRVRTAQRARREGATLLLRAVEESAAIRRDIKLGANVVLRALFDRWPAPAAAGFGIMLLFSYLYKQFSLFDSPGFQASFHAVR